MRDIYPTPDTVTVSFALESGLVGSGTWAYTSGAEVDEMEFIGTTGKITFAVSVPTPFTVVDDDDGIRSFDIGYPEWVHQPMVESIVAEMRGEGRCSSTGRSAAAPPGSLTRCCERSGPGRLRLTHARIERTVARCAEISSGLHISRKNDMIAALRGHDWGDRG